MLSEMDDYLLHQTPEPVRFVGTSDRNFYDRYYFNVHDCSDRWFLIVGLGQYPNLAVQDAFATARVGDRQYVVRSSRELGDRADTSCGPIRVEVIKGLQTLRLVIEPNETGIEADLVFEGSHPAIAEPRQFDRRHGRVMSDLCRYGQNGYYTGTITLPELGQQDVEAGALRGYRDRSWGIRPVGEPEPQGIQKTTPPDLLWLYCAAQFDDFSLMLKVHDLNDGRRVMEEAVRVWNDPGRDVEHLGTIEHELQFSADKRSIAGGVLQCPDAPGGGMNINVQAILPHYMMLGTGYFPESAGWVHGAYQGPSVTETEILDVGDDAADTMGLIDAVARFQVGDHTGYGLFEYGVIGSFAKYGLEGTGYWNAPTRSDTGQAIA